MGSSHDLPEGRDDARQPDLGLLEQGLPDRARGRAPIVFSSLAPARPTEVYDTFWYFAAERQAVFYEGDQDPREVFFRTILFKIFNRIETWEMLEDEFGTVSHADYSLEKYDAFLTRVIESGRRLFSAAYIMPSGGKRVGSSRKHSLYLKLLRWMMEDAVPERLSEARSMREAFGLLRGYPMIGDFLAYQYVTDL